MYSGEVSGVSFNYIRVYITVLITMIKYILMPLMLFNLNILQNLDKFLVILYYKIRGNCIFDKLNQNLVSKYISTHEYV